MNIRQHEVQADDGTDSTDSRPVATLWTTVRDDLRARRAARAARKTLVRELASYTTPADLDDLHAVLNRYDDAEVAEIRQILGRNRRWVA